MAMYTFLCIVWFVDIYRVFLSLLFQYYILQSQSLWAKSYFRLFGKMKSQKEKAIFNFAFVSLNMFKLHYILFLL